MPWSPYPSLITEPQLRLFVSAPSSAGTRTRAIAIYDAFEFPEGDSPEASLWGAALDRYLYADIDDDDGDGDDDRGYPAGWLTRNSHRIAEDIVSSDFHHAIFPLHLVASTGRVEPFERARVKAGSVFVGQWFRVDVGTPTLYLALRPEQSPDGLTLRIRGADHAHRDGQPCPQSWDTMDHAWGNRRFEFVVAWEPFWTAYEALHA